MSYPVENEQHSMQSESGSIRGIPGEPGYNPMYDSDGYELFIEGQYTPFLITTENTEQPGELEHTEPGV